MQIILDVTRLVRRLIKGQIQTGIDRVTMAYVNHYGHTAHALVRWAGHSWILSSKQSHALFQWIANPDRIWTVRFILLKGIMSKKNFTSQTFLLNTGHIGLGQSDYSRLIQKFGIKAIFFVHDLIPMSHPEYCSTGEALRHQKKINHVLKLASGILTNSTATLRDLNDYAQQKNQNMPRVEIALLAPGMSLKPPGKRPIAKPYFVILSTIEPRKNHLLILHIWRSLYEELGLDAPHLYVIGQRGWECEQVLDLLDRCSSLKKVVTEVPYCQDSDLITYIHHSQALLFPSFIEGYGLPLIEALSIGTPVIASNLSVFHEIAQDIPEYVDPIDGKRWKELILDYTQLNSVARASQITRMNSFKPPQWKEHFIKVDSLLTELKSLGFTQR
jgi:glycosyltransferase involved in cell wall biosynthesis